MTIDWRWVIVGLLYLATFSFLVGYVTDRLDERDAIRRILLAAWDEICGIDKGEGDADKDRIGF